MSQDKVEMTLAEALTHIQSGDQSLRNNLIIKYQPFVLNAVSKALGRYIHTENDDEFIIGLMAFNHAIDTYKQDKGSFVGFAERVIRNRVIDYLRKEKSHIHIEPLEDFKDLSVGSPQQEDQALEVNIFIDKLKFFGIELDDLVAEAPKHAKTKKEVTDLSIQASKKQTITRYLYKSKHLPIAEMVIMFQTTKKQVKRFRKFIIAIIVVYVENLSSIKHYLAVKEETS